MAKTKREELDSLLALQSADLAKLEKARNEKQTRLQGLERSASEELSAVPMDQLEAQAQARAASKLQAEALNIEVGELQRRIGLQMQAIGETQKALAEEHRAALLAEAERRHAIASASGRQLLADLAAMTEVGKRLEPLSIRAPFASELYNLTYALTEFIEAPERERKRIAEWEANQREAAEKAAKKAAEKQARIEAGRAMRINGEKESRLPLIVRQ